MTDYTLYYFEVRGLGEPCRMVLHYAGVAFQDVRIKHTDWAKMKKKMPQGTVPVLVVDGKKKLSQSSAIAMFLARKYGLAGSSAWEMARVDEAMNTMKDMYLKMAPWCYVQSGLRQGDLDELFETVAKPTADQYFPIVARMLKLHQDTFIAGTRPTVADFFMAEFLFSIHGFSPEMFEGHEKLSDYFKRVHSLPRLKDYIKSRPHTPW